MTEIEFSLRCVGAFVFALAAAVVTVIWNEWDKRRL